MLAALQQTPHSHQESSSEFCQEQPRSVAGGDASPRTGAAWRYSVFVQSWCTRAIHQTLAAHPHHQPGRRTHLAQPAADTLWRGSAGKSSQLQRTFNAALPQSRPRCKLHRKKAHKTSLKALWLCRHCRILIVCCKFVGRAQNADLLTAGAAIRSCISSNSLQCL